MKSKKKLLLMGVGVMGALAMGVGATSTFAWFGAQAAAAVAGTKNESVSVNADKYQIGSITIPVVATITKSQADANLVLAQYKDGTTPKLASGYIDAGGVFREVTDATTFGASKVFYSTATVNLAINYSATGWTISGTSATFTPTGSSTVYTSEQIRTLVNNSKAKIQVKPNGRTRIFATDAASGNPAASGYGTADASGYYTVATGDSISIGAATFENDAVKGTNPTYSLSTTFNYYVFGDEGASATGTTDGATGRNAETTKVDVSFDVIISAGA